MPYVAPGLIAVVTSPIAYFPVDEDGKVTGDPITFAKGDVIHDEAFVKELHDKHFHHALTTTPHHVALCPLECDVHGVQPPPAPPIQIAPPAPASVTQDTVAAATIASTSTNGVN